MSPLEWDLILGGITGGIVMHFYNKWKKCEKEKK